MSCKQDRPKPCVLASKPSSSFSTISSAASATSAATSRSGGTKLLFGEIDTTSDRSSESYASVCNFVLCDSSTFLKFWLEDKCRETFLSFLPRNDLASLRLACHDFSVRAAPALFSDLSITFKTNSFTKPSKLAALDRLGFYVKSLQFNLPHTADTLLQPLVEPETGEELSFTYTPQMHEPSSVRKPKYGDIETTDILTRQYPRLFHAATNVPAFIRAFSALINLEHLTVSCPGYNPTHRYRRSVVDYALISLRIAVEKNSLNALHSLSLTPIHPGGLMYLSPLLGLGASPRSASRWSRIKNLSIQTVTLPAAAALDSEPDQFKLLQTYLRNFQLNLESFRFRWIGQKGPLPVRCNATKASRAAAAPLFGEHPSCAQGKTSAGPTTTTPATAAAAKARQPLFFPKIKTFEVENISTPAATLAAFIAAHKRSVEELNLEDVELTAGSWDDALAPLAPKPPPRRRRTQEMADIPIMLSPTTRGSPHLPFSLPAATAAAAPPVPMQRVEVAHHAGGRKSLRMSRWLLAGPSPASGPASGSKGKTATLGPTAAKRVREGLLGCEQQLRRVLRGSAFPWS